MLNYFAKDTDITNVSQTLWFILVSFVSFMQKCTQLTSATIDPRVFILSVPSIAISYWLLSGSIFYKEEPAVILRFCCSWELNGILVCNA